MKFYREQRKDWKKEWKMYKKAKKQEWEDYLPFHEWVNEHLTALAKSDPNKFEEYCSGFKKAQKYKVWAAFGTAAVVAALCAGVGLDMALYYGGVTAQVQAASLPLAVVAVGTYVGAVFASGRARATRFLDKIWHKSGWKLHKIVLNFGKKRDKSKPRVYLKTFDSESYQTESRGFPAWLKRARLPKIMQDYFKTGEIKFDIQSDENEPAKIEPEVSKEERKKEWYKANMLEADKLYVSLYGSSKDFRPDYYKKLGEYEVDSFNKIFDKDSINVVLGDVGKSVVDSLNDELLVGVKTDADIRVETSFTHINKSDYTPQHQSLASEDVPEATL